MIAENLIKTGEALLSGDFKAEAFKNTPSRDITFYISASCTVGLHDVSIENYVGFIGKTIAGTRIYKDIEEEYESRLRDRNRKIEELEKKLEQLSIYKINYDLNYQMAHGKEIIKEVKK